MNTAPDPRPVLATLKDFQQRTVDHVFDRLFDPSGTHRFLVADEVGLGKTMVAKGIIARTLEHLWDSVKRIDVIYICSNEEIARQNLRRLRIPGVPSAEYATRITMMPTKVRELSKNKVNFLSFTPGTSFEQTQGGGAYMERVILYWLLDRAWKIRGQAASINVLQGGMRAKNFRWHVKNFDSSTLDADLGKRFIKELSGNPKHRETFKQLCQVFPRSDSRVSAENWLKRREWIGELRRILAQVCLRALEPDLIILDEFQRFRHLMDPTTTAGELAAGLFDYASEHEQARVLLLSATPYKMLSLYHEDEDHYRDFLETVQFLENGSSKTSIEELLTSYRRCLLTTADDGDSMMRAGEAMSRVASRLRRVMTRTERELPGNQSSAMLREVNGRRLTLEKADVVGYVGLAKVADVLGHGDALEYWKSAPYVLNFMERYQLRKMLKAEVEQKGGGPKLARVVADFPETFLESKSLVKYRRIDPANARLRALEGDTIGAGLWKLLWLPPSLPYHQPAGPFADVDPTATTKRLVFSSWHVVPRTVAALLSYEAERRIATAFDPKASNTPVERKKLKPLLRFTRSNERLTGMPVLGLVYPSVFLARTVDPARVRSQSGAAGIPSLSQVLTAAAVEIRSALLSLPIKDSRQGPADEAWYWLAPLLLDRCSCRKEVTGWWGRDDLASVWRDAGMKAPDETAEEERDRWHDHVDEARKIVTATLAGRHTPGPQPDDLADVLALLACAGLATAPMRAMMRCRPPTSDDEIHALMISAGKVGHAFLTLFNHPESQTLIRIGNRDEAYWRNVLGYAAGGCLQAVLDEYVHLLAEASGEDGTDAAAVYQHVASELCEVLTMRTAVAGIDSIVASRDRQRVEMTPLSMRLRFAMRFGDERSEDESAGLEGVKTTRKERVRAAFNSPFWPFVLATTSVGQEGLDFHPYCHAVVHWNLPSNPVDLEQREGRVHRYKGHAVRKNLAAALGDAVLTNLACDPWNELFELARQQRQPGQNDLVPYWLFDGPCAIERHVPCLPFSRETRRIEELKHALVLYRMVFGQPRQEDLLDFLRRRFSDPGQAAKAASVLRIDLSPP